MSPEERFRAAVETVLRHEGGYVHDPADPGGETKYGISKRSYPELDIANLTREQAIEIYRRDWWDRYGYDRIKSLDVAAKVFDLAVNMGPAAAHKCLQQALHACGQRHVTIDGVLGPQTIEAANNVRPRAMLLAALRAEAAAYYRQLVEQRPELKRFEQGWLNRAYA
ncbi:MAG: peptidoglycan-binding protein [Actinobacteria bacterium]|nr:MAG: peptidoglycan-binding protein [Actinomycetota bacterium]